MCEKLGSGSDPIAVWKKKVGHKFRLPSPLKITKLCHSRHWVPLFYVFWKVSKPNHDHHRLHECTQSSNWWEQSEIVSMTSVGCSAQPALPLSISLLNSNISSSPVTSLSLSAFAPWPATFSASRQRRCGFYINVIPNSKEFTNPGARPRDCRGIVSV